MASSSEPMPNLIAQFKNVEGEATGPQLSLPSTITTEQLNILINELLTNEDKLPYSFYIEGSEITTSLTDAISQLKDFSTENTLTIVYQPQSLFRVRSVARCTSSLPGHSEAILSVSFSPDGSSLATGSGDATVRLWDIETETPLHTLSGHRNWVLCVAWSPDSKKVASGSRDDEIRVWDTTTGKRIVGPLKGHSKWITSISWEPLHKNPACTRFASSSKDGTVRIWDIATGRCELSLTSHTAGVSCVKWGGQGLIYTASQDRSVRVWEAATGKLIRCLEGHAHWVNTMALSTDYVLRTGAFDHTRKKYEDPEEARAVAQARYDAVAIGGKERLVTGSDDFTLFLWEPTSSNKPVARMTGHQQLVNQVSFSPDGRTIASASFDKSVRLWDGHTGKFIATLRGHVGAVYQVNWSADSRLLVSGSKDSTMKVWDLKTKKMAMDLPGHADEVYSVDWSPDGEKVASGGKDRILKLWRS